MADRRGDHAHLHAGRDLQPGHVLVKVEVGQLADQAAHRHYLFANLQIGDDVFLRFARTALRQRDGYSLQDIGIGYSRDWYRVDLSVTNLFDKAYATYQQSQTTTYTYEEGRSVNLTLSARF